MRVRLKEESAQSEPHTSRLQKQPLQRQKQGKTDTTQPFQKRKKKTEKPFGRRSFLSFAGLPSFHSRLLLLLYFSILLLLQLQSANPNLFNFLSQNGFVGFTSQLAPQVIPLLFFFFFSLGLYCPLFGFLENAT